MTDADPGDEDDRTEREVAAMLKPYVGRPVSELHRDLEIDDDGNFTFQFPPPITVEFVLAPSIDQDPGDQHDYGRELLRALRG